MTGLLSLPYEALSYIVGQLDFDDIYNLGQTCRGLKYLLYEERIAKFIVEVCENFNLHGKLSGF